MRGGGGGGCWACRSPPHFVPKTPPFVPTPPPPTTDLAGMDPGKTNMHQQHPFCQKTPCLPHACYTCGPLCTKKTTRLPPSVLKKTPGWVFSGRKSPPLPMTQPPPLAPPAPLPTSFWG